MKRIVYLPILMFVLITAILAVFLSQTPTEPHIYAQSAYPPPAATVLYLPPTPYPAPEDVTAYPTTVPIEKLITAEISIDVVVEGLEGNDTAELQIVPDTSITTSRLQTLGIAMPILSLHNETQRIAIATIPIGTYKLMVSAPTAYFREPQGYLFQVSEAGIVGSSDTTLHFMLIPPSAQDLPPCRDSSLQSDTTASESESQDPLLEENAVCQSEYIIDLSAPLKQPEPWEQENNSLLSVGYHYVGPKTTQSNKGILGRNFVVNPGVIHGGAGQFIAERVYASTANGANWIEAGWAEVSWRDNRQYVYQYDSTTQAWHWYDQYTLSTGTPVETLVKSDGNYYWIAELYWNGNFQRLTRVVIGFDTASLGYNRGEAYTADGVHPILPVSRFDMGYINLTGGSTWNVWDTRYPTTVNQDYPYQCDMIYLYDVFDIHSPIFFLPLILRNYY
jgi:hypothetical protein